MSNKKLHITLSFIYGLSIGAIGGLLFAPDKGEETRKKVLHRLEELSVELKKTSQKLLAKTKSVGESLQGESNTIVKEAVEKANHLMKEVDQLKKKITEK